jgi:glycosyltransferase involved in cell wall biosynthesis
VFGGLTPEKRIPQILAAFRATLPYAPGAWLLLAGTRAAHADFSPADFADVADRVTLTGYVADEVLTDHIASVDVSLNLRWPTARETSGPWLRALAAARPTIITDLLQATDVATLDPRTWQARPSIVARQPTPPEQPVAIAVDILDEDHSLRLAMRRLATDADLRATLGRAAQEYWQREHSIEAMADDYERIIQAVLHAAPAAPVLPAHMRPDGGEQLRALLQPFGMDSPI